MTRGTFYLIATLAALLATTCAMYLTPAPADVKYPELSRNLYIHVPAALGGFYVAFTVTLIGSVAYLAKRDLRWDRFAAAGAEVGVLFCIANIVNGMIWSKYEWGAPWHWDPIQTMTLIVALAYLAYLGFRASIVEREGRARLSSVLGILLFVLIPLNYATIRLGFLGPSLMEELGRFVKPELEPMVRGIMFGPAFIGFLMLTLYLVHLGAKTMEAEERLEEVLAR